MRCPVFLATCLTLAAGTAGHAAVTVIGNSPARSCYEAARDSSRAPTAMDNCDFALRNEALDRHDEAATHVNRGVLRAIRGDNAGALADYDAALAIKPDEPEAFLNKAFVFLRNGDAAGAVTLFDAAVARRTREPAMAHYGRGVAYEESGNVKAAYGDYVKARALKPDWDAPQNELRRFRVNKSPAFR